MKVNFLKKIFFLILVIFMTTLMNPQQEVVIKIREGVSLIPVAIPDFILKDGKESTATCAKIIHKTLWEDLEFSRVFSLAPRDIYPQISSSGKINFKEWQGTQVNILVSGEVESPAEGRITLTLKTWDAKSGGFIFGRSYGGKVEDSRLIAHKVADQMMINFGEKPIFTSKIVFVSDRDGNMEIYMMDWDGYNQTRLTYNNVVDLLPSISLDKKLIAYTSYRKMNPDLYIYNLLEGKNIAVFSKGINYSADFSPDGKKIAFVSSMHGNAEIYVANCDGTDLKRLTFNPSIDTSPSWSPSGKEIAFTSDRSGSPQIYIMDADGANVRRLSFEGTYNDSPTWSPDGDRIAWVSRINSSFDIYVYNLRNNTVIKLTENSGRNENPSWSPDGRHLVFASNRTGTYHIYTVDYDGSNLRRLTNSGNNKMPKWSKK
ncbi:MAG: Tol-Pal system beta propeller repeat protein TolB [Candidatus Aminicenantia bacterium]